MSSEIFPVESVTSTQSAPARVEAAVESEAIEGAKSTTDASDVPPSPAKDGTPPVAESSTAAASEELKSTPAVEAKPSTIAETDSHAVDLSNTPISKLSNELPSIIEEAGHNEMWGITLIDEAHIPTSIVLEKFLRANDKDVLKAKAQLTNALKWRKTVNPVKLLSDFKFDRSKFGNLGYVTSYERADEQGKEIITWNIYGGVENLKSTFGDVNEFIKWRCALMELSINELDLTSAATKIPENGSDPYRMIQVHDYLSVSFLRMDPAVRAASKETIQVFSMAYPELLKEKFFVNVPTIMGWVFAAMKIFLSEATIKKFHPLSNGGSLAREIPGIGAQLPTVYGGKGKPVTEFGATVKHADGDEATDATANTTEGDKQTVGNEDTDETANTAEGDNQADVMEESKVAQS